MNRIVQWFGNLPIKHKLTIMTMLSCGVALLLVAVAFVSYELIVFRTTLVNELTSTARSIAYLTSVALTFQDPKEAEEVLSSLRADPRVRGGAVFDAAGKVFAVYRRAGSPGHWLPPSVRPAGHRFGADHLEVFCPVERAGVLDGTVYVLVDLSEMRARLQRYAWIVGGVMLASSLVAFGISRKLQQVISDPIRSLATVTRTVAEERNYAVRAVKTTEGEMGLLIDGFNRMLQEIQTRDAALDQARMHLERRVEERTAELQAEIVERKHAEEALRASEGRIRLIVDTAFDAIATSDESGKIVEWNAQAEATFGWSRDEALGRDFARTLLPPRYYPTPEQHFQLWRLHPDKPLSNRRLELSALHKDGHEFPIELAISPFSMGKGLYFSAFLRDITERKQVEAKLEDVHKQLLDASRRAGMTEIATSVLHNVGNVLNSVNVSTNLIAETVHGSRTPKLTAVGALLTEHRETLGHFLTCDEKGKQLPGYLVKLAECLSAEQKLLLNETVSLSKNVEHIKDIVVMQQNYATSSGLTEKLDLTSLVEDALRLNAAALLRHGITVLRDYSPDLPQLLTEKHKVLQILVNLIRNARFACDESERPDKCITVRVTRDGESVRIHVIDNGVGIPPENLTRIFSFGFTTRPQGHGFGLHSSILAAGELRGRLSAQSDGLGKGATFILELPFQPAREGREKKTDQLLA